MPKQYAMSNKIKTFILTSNSGATELISTDIQYIIDTLQTELQDNDLDENDEDDTIEYTITVEKKYTQEEVDNLPEWDGF